MNNPALALPRAVQIPHNYNNRHLGNLAVDGGKMSSEKIIRTGRTTEYTHKDIEILVNQYQLKTVLDLRTSTELQQEAGRILNDVPGVEYVHMSMFDEDDSTEKDIIRSSEVRIRENPETLIAFFKSLGGTLDDVISFYNDTYYTIVTSDTSINVIRRFFDILLERSTGSTLFHCMGGKDRTGSVAAFYLLALGVDWNICEADYILSNNFYMAGTFPEVLDEVLEMTGDPLIVEGAKLICFADVRYLVKAQDYIRANFGTVDRYMAEVLLLTEEKKQALRELYTT